MKQKIFICGGHLTPALSILEELPSRITPIVIGRPYAMEGDDTTSEEMKVLKAKNVEFLPLTAGRLQRKFTVHTLASLFKFPIGLIQAMIYILREKPSLVVSFGGYIALPVCLSAWTLRVPVVTHEQTLSPGLANRIIAKIATRVCVTFNETKDFADSRRVTVTGLPMRQELFREVRMDLFKKRNASLPILFITGGSTGSQSINQLVFPVLGSLTKTWTVIHQTGQHSADTAKAVRSSNYFHKPYFTTTEMSWIFAHASLVIGRSGANTTIELAVLGKTAILIPLPWAAGNEQLLHANWLSQHNGSMVLPQLGLTPQALEDAIEELNESIVGRQEKAKAFAAQVPRDGAKKLAQIVLSLLS